MEKEEIYWLGFSAFPGIGPYRFRLLLQFFGTAERAWQAKEGELLQAGLGETLVKKFLSFRKNFSLTDYQARLEKEKVRVIRIIDKDYPPLLKEISDAPFLLYVRGESFRLADFEKTIAVVGTRKMTSYGEEVTRKLVVELVEAGFTIISGMAYGVDTVAHQTAIEAGGRTIAVLGCGVDVIHPKSNTALYWQIAKEKGAVISEFPLGQWAERGLFPARNRIISGLSLGVVVTEGAKDSGALITARYAAEQGREVFAVPGPITFAGSQGTSFLLKNGAKLVSQAEDIFEEINPLLVSRGQSELVAGQREKTSFFPSENLSSEEKKILAILGQESCYFDQLVKKSSLSSAKLAEILTLLEMKKLVKTLSNGQYQINL